MTHAGRCAAQRQAERRARDLERVKQARLPPVAAELANAAAGLADALARLRG
jgi:hypothetical protein